MWRTYDDFLKIFFTFPPGILTPSASSEASTGSFSLFYWSEFDAHSTLLSLLSRLEDNPMVEIQNRLLVENEDDKIQLPEILSNPPRLKFAPFASNNA